jgi:transketolase
MTLRSGDDLTIIAAGAMVGRSLLAAEKLVEQGISARVVNMPCVKPIDTELICQAASETRAIVTAEEHTVIGGLGGAVAEVLGTHQPTPISHVGINDIFTRTAPSPETLMDAYGLAVDDIIAAAESVLRRK